MNVPEVVTATVKGLFVLLKDYEPRIHNSSIAIGTMSDFGYKWWWVNVYPDRVVLRKDFTPSLVVVFELSDPCCFRKLLRLLRKLKRSAD